MRCWSFILSVVAVLFISELIAGETNSSGTVFGLHLQPVSETAPPSDQTQVAPFDRDAILGFLNHNHGSSEQRFVVVLPSIFDSQGIIQDIRRVLRDHGSEAKVFVVRKPKGSFERIINFFPRHDDWEPSLPAELRAGHVSVFIGESVSVGYFIYSSVAGGLNAPIAVIASTVDLFQSGLMFYPIRFWSNYFNRISTPERFLCNFLISTLYSSNFFFILNAGNVREALPSYWQVVLPSSAFFTLWRTAVSTSVFLWESARSNALSLEKRRIVRSRVLMGLQLFLSPLYIYSISPWARSLNDRLDINSGHLGMIVAGLMGLTAWNQRERLAYFTTVKVPELIAQAKDRTGNFCRVVLSAIRR